MKYKRNKSYSKYTRYSQGYGGKKGKGFAFIKIPSYIIFITLLLFCLAKLMQMSSVSLPGALKNTRAEAYLNKASKAVQYGENFVSMLGQKGAEFVLGYLKSDSSGEKEEKVFAQNTSDKDTAQVLSDAKPKEQTTETEPLFSPSMPCEGEISSPFGQREHPLSGEGAFHNGIDIAIDSGTDIRAIEDGTIEKSTYNQYSGNFIVISHGGGYTSSYAHLRECKVNKGDKVKKGDIIGISGSTGMATGPHLHMEIRKDGTAVNPLELIAA